MSWRIEPTPRADGVEEGLAARIHDPLWLLARQWQMGEFRGQDAGTPAIVRMVGSAAPVYAWRGAGQTEWAPLNSDTTPLDALVESEAVDGPTIRQRIDAGAHFLRLLTSASSITCENRLRLPTGFPQNSWGRRQCALIRCWLPWLLAARTEVRCAPPRPNSQPAGRFR